MLDDSWIIERDSESRATELQISVPMVLMADNRESSLYAHTFDFRVTTFSDGQERNQQSSESVFSSFQVKRYGLYARSAQSQQ